jgi:hypothetical protein
MMVQFISIVLTDLIRAQRVPLTLYMWSFILVISAS